MFISSKLAEVCIGDMDRLNPKYLNEFFAVQKKNKKKTKYGVYGSQLTKEYKLPKRLATKMSALLNGWYMDLSELEKNKTLPVNLITRLTRCTDVFNTNKSSDWRCKKKICPWCRAALVLEIEAAVASSGAHYCTVSDFRVSDTLPRIPEAPGACMGIKNVIYEDQWFTLRVMKFYTSKKNGSLSVESNQIRELMGYDYNLLTSSDVLLTWMKITNGMNMFTKGRSKVKS